MKQLQFRHNCQNLGCADLRCSHCRLSQKRRCEGNFSSKYLAPCDVIEAKCSAQIYVVVVDAFTGELMMQGLDDAFLELAIIDGRKFEQEGNREDALDSCKLLVNKQGHPLLAHGRSGSYSDDKHVVVPMIHGQCMLPDLKITESSEALLTGRAPPFRLMARAIWRTGERIPGISPVLSEPFVVATARVKGAAKVEIPHVEDHISKLEGLGLQTQKKLEDIVAAAAAAGVPTLDIPVNCVTKVGQFRDLVLLAEENKPLQETLKQVLRLTKGWDLAREHAMKAVNSDVQLRAYYPDGRTDVGLVYKCGPYNVVDIQHPIGLLRRRPSHQVPNQDFVDVIWLPEDTTYWPDAVKKLVPRAAAAWWNDAHPGWAFLPLNLSHVPVYKEDGNPSNSMSSFTFTKQQRAGGEAHGSALATGSAANGCSTAQFGAMVPQAPIVGSGDRPWTSSSGAPAIQNMNGNNHATKPSSYPSGVSGIVQPVGFPAAVGPLKPMAGNLAKDNESRDAQLQNIQTGRHLPHTMPTSTEQIFFQQVPGSATRSGRLPDGAPASMAGVSMGDLRQMFQRAVRQEMSFEEIEFFLKQHNLVPEDEPNSNADQSMVDADGIMET